MNAYNLLVPQVSRQTERSNGPSRVDLFRLLGDEGRLQLLALCAQEELSVGELAEVLRESQPQVSRKVSSLRQHGLLEARRDGTRTLLRTGEAGRDAVLAAALAEGRRLCLADGSLGRVPRVVAAREESGRAYFEQGGAEAVERELAPLALGHLAAMAPLLPGNELAVDVGTGEGQLLDVLAPLYHRVIGVDRSPAQLARCANRVASRGFHHVSLYQGSYDDAALLERVHAAGGADLVFAARTLHHASRPAQAVAGFSRLLKRGGHLVVLDYRPHERDEMREQGDVWLGFAPESLAGWLTEAGLVVVGQLDIPASFHREGPDAPLAWHAVVARRQSP